MRKGLWEDRSESKLFDRDRVLRQSGVDVLGWDTETCTSGDEGDFSV